MKKNCTRKFWQPSPGVLSSLHHSPPWRQRGAITQTHTRRCEQSHTNHTPIAHQSHTPITQQPHTNHTTSHEPITHMSSHVIHKKSYPTARFLYQPLLRLNLHGVDEEVAWGLSKAVICRSRLLLMASSSTWAGSISSKFSDDVENVSSVINSYPSS